ncbi:MAG: DUF1476 domain-containing protein [Acetobacteraceae bacterium]|nr:DUF1476 domain-containing protein [Acetobacteraceae bacterium]
MIQIQTALAADITLHSLEQATAESPRARRNLLIGLWAGRRLGLPEAELPRYALDVMWVDHAEPGDADVIHKLAADFDAAGCCVGDEALRSELTVAQRRAYAETVLHLL